MRDKQLKEAVPIESFDFEQMSLALADLEVERLETRLSLTTSAVCDIPGCVSNPLFMGHDHCAPICE